MKQSFRKAVSAFCAVAMLVSTLAVGGVGVFAAQAGVDYDRRYYLADNLAPNGAITASKGTAKNGNTAVITDGSARTNTWDPDTTAEGLPYIEVKWEESVTVEKIAFYVTAGTTSLSQNKPEYIQFKYWNGTDWTTITDGKEKNANGITVIRKAITNKDKGPDSDKIFDRGFDPEKDTPVSGTNYYLHTGTAAMYLFTVELANPVETTQFRVDISQYFVDKDGKNQVFNVKELEIYAPAAVEPTEEPTLPEYTLTENLVSRGTLTASNMTGDKALVGDGTVRTGSCASGGTNANIKIDWDEPATITKVVIYYTAPVNSTTVKYATVDGAPTKNDWTGAFTATDDKFSSAKIYDASFDPTKDTPTAGTNYYDKTDNVEWNRQVLVPSDPESAKAARHLRIITSSGSFAIAEIEVFGTLASDLPPEVTTSNTKKVTVGTENIARLPEATVVASSEKSSAKMVYVNDGDRARWQPSDNTNYQTVQTTEWIAIAWNEAKPIKELHLYWRDTGNSPAIDSYTVEITNDSKVNGDSDWQEITPASKTKSNTGSYDEICPHLTGTDTTKNASKDTIVFGEVVTAKAVRIKITMKIKQAQLSEFEIYSDEYTAPVTSFNDTVAYWRDAVSGIDKAKDVYIFTDIAQGCVPEEKVAQVTIKATRGGVEKTTSVLIWDAWEAVSLFADGKDQTVDATQLKNTEEAYVIGILLTDLCAGDEIDVSFSIVDIPEE